MSKEAVITGIGVITPAGVGKADFWQGMVSGQSFLSPITSFDTARYTSKIGGAIKDFDPASLLDPRIMVQTDRWTQFDMISAKQAIDDAGVQIRDEDPTRVGAVFAAGTGGNEYGQRQLHICSSQGPKHVSVYLSIAWFYAASIGQVSISNAIRGYGRNICAEAAGGPIALGHAAKTIAQSTCDVVIVGGCEAPLTPYTFASHQASGLMSPENGDHPYRPFDATRQGTVAGEGGASFCVESKEHAQRRNAHIYGEIAGWGQSFDGVQTREPAADGKEYARAIEQALKMAQLQPTDIDWILCDGLGTQQGDKAEARALQAVFGDALASIPASAPKSMIGRLFNGGSTVDVAAALLGMQTDTVLPTVGFTQPDAECPLDCVPNQVRTKQIRHVLVGARGFGGYNSAIILKRPF
ncbi:beta-ketoacyl-[acyl-carrier-protein] synthase family protein [Dictyobacter formicarum]|uniref:Actinorhodin polyketide beta-ketoacyl synthase n=1 Tax=Dictyobacter formicarum TaxID=2778368 RepID=A0ABQ3VUR5_9CHLR|nr:beta-ketoacyl synthase N-terminal-like domain-containing protein [Dictyobacter formicarum]GHO89535.1 actinorhodin polyketide beta-ketoacyl synthase [Dictyobacter formicarum]